MTGGGVGDVRYGQLLALAAVDDPSLDAARALPLLNTCLAMAEEDPAADAAEIARRCVTEHPDADASWIAHLARAVLLLSGDSRNAHG